MDHVRIDFENCYGINLNLVSLRSVALPRAVPRLTLRLRAVDLDPLSVVDISPKGFFNSLKMGAVTIGCQLNTVR